MTGGNGHLILDVPYQGNGWWAVVGLGSLFLLTYILFRVNGKRKAGLPINVQGVIVACIFFLGVFALALFQVLSHQ